jgi:hypothetical protein
MYEHIVVKVIINQERLIKPRDVKLNMKMSVAIKLIMNAIWTNLVKRNWACLMINDFDDLVFKP